MIHSIGDRHLETEGEDFYIAPGAQVIGSVRLRRGASIWFNAVLRADNDTIEIGEDSNVQDGSVLHTDPGLPLIVGRCVTIGHVAFLHACTVADHALIANGARVLDGAHIGSFSIVAAGALVPPGKKIPERVVVMGSPARIVREVTDADLERMRAGVETYRARAREYRARLVTRQVP